MPALNEVYAQYRDRAAFYFVYIEEAHPSDAWQTSSNLREKVVFATPQSLEERVGVGLVCVKSLKVDLPVIVDEIDNRTERAYTAWPDRLYVVDEGGRIAFKSPAGPFGFEAEPVARTLAGLVGPPADRAAEPPATDSAQPPERSPSPDPSRPAADTPVG